MSSPPLPEQDPRETSRQLAFTFALIALSARLARCHVRLERSAYLAFREAFPLEDDASSALRALFRLAWEDATPLAYYARQVKKLYPHRQDLWRELIARLIRVAQADGPLNAPEWRILDELGKAFGISPRGLRRLIAQSEKRASDPFRLLGIARHAKADALKSRYRELMRHYHPDAASTRMRYPEARMVAEHKAAEIAAAYRTLQHS